MPEDSGSAEEFWQIIYDPARLAEGLPIAAKVREGQRFCKITPPKAMLDDAAPIAPENLADEVAEETPINIEEDADAEPGDAKEHALRDFGKKSTAIMRDDDEEPRTGTATARASDPGAQRR